MESSPAALKLLCLTLCGCTDIAGAMTTSPTHAATVIARELNLAERGVAAVLALLDEGATVPFIARYRKERTGSLDDLQVSQIAARRGVLAELVARRKAIERAIAEQGAMTAALLDRLAACRTRAELEDVYAPFKKRRKTRGDVAREAGYGPIAAEILRQPNQPRMSRPSDEALAGARDIVAEELANTPALRALIRKLLAEHGRVTAKKKRGLKVPAGSPAPFEAFYGQDEAVRRIPSHRYLAICRGEDQGALSVSVAIDLDRTLDALLRRIRYVPRSPLGPVLREAAADSLKRLLLPAATTAVRAELKQRADEAAIDVFGRNLTALLMAAPLGALPVVGIDPGIRTGCKCAVVTQAGEVVADATLYMVGRGSDHVEQARNKLRHLIDRYAPHAIAVGNGTGGRETEALVREVVKAHAPTVIVVSVNEAGASVYSASDIAREELPQLDVTIRGAVSIARRLQDPLAELVKIDPKAIGVGQYQHDVDQKALKQRLNDVVERCVNGVGVELSTASAPLLAQVAGIGPKLSRAIVAHRKASGGFASRRALRDVAGLGAKAFEQCAGFLRVSDGTHPLDASAVHPERYPIVERMAADLGVPLAKLVGDAALTKRIEPERYVSDDVGLPTLTDILRELEKPGRDPRKQFEAPAFRADVNTVDDLREGMVLSGVVTNVTDFGAFVDVGVHQDGLVHVSKLADTFVRDPHAVVSAGDRVSVRVLDVDVKRKRISLQRMG